MNISSHHCVASTPMGLAWCCPDVVYREESDQYFCQFSSAAVVSSCRQTLQEHLADGLRVACTPGEVLEVYTSPASRINGHGLLKKLLVVLFLLGLCSASTADTLLNKCSETASKTPTLYATMGYYSDSACRNMTSHVNYYSSIGSCMDIPGARFCYPAEINAGRSAFGMLLYAYDPRLQIDLTEAQECTQGQASQAMFATFSALESGCVQLSALSGKEGVVIWPKGNDNLQKRETISFRTSSDDVQSTLVIEQDHTAVEHGKRRENIHCTGFRVSSSKIISTSSRSVSAIVNCGQSSATCTLGMSDVITMKSTYVLDNGSRLAYFDIRKAFGVDYSNTVVTQEQKDLVVPVGQQGYFSAYVRATLFRGNFTGCSSGVEGHMSGEVVALHANGLLYQTVLTN